MSASFWKLFGIGVVSTIDTLLQKEDVTVEQLLAEDELLNECKYGNKQLLGFVLRPDVLRRLFELLKAPVAADADTKVQRYPHLASEILCTDGWWDFFHQHLFDTHTDLISDLWGYFLGEGPFPAANVTAVSRVAGTFFDRVPLRSFALMPRETLVDALLKHCEQLAVVELLLKIDIASQRPENETIKQWLDGAALLNKLLGKLNPTESTILERETISEILLEQVSRPESYQLVSRLQQPEVFATLFDFVLQSSATVPELLPVLSLIIGLLKQENPIAYDATTPLDELPPFMNKLLAGTARFIDLLKAPTPSLVLSHQKEVTTIGNSKLKIVELVASIVRLKRKALLEQLIDSNLITACLELFFSQPWNNFMHKLGLDILLSIIGTNDTNIIKKLITATDLLTSIARAAADHEKDTQQEKHIQRGYMGHLAILSEALLELATEEGMMPIFESNRDFVTYLNTILFPTQKRQFCWQTLPGLPEKYLLSADSWHTTIPDPLIDQSILTHPDTLFFSPVSTDSEPEDNAAYRLAPNILAGFRNEEEQDPGFDEEDSSEEEDQDNDGHHDTPRSLPSDDSDDESDEDDEEHDVQDDPKQASPEQDDSDQPEIPSHSLS